MANVTVGTVELRLILRDELSKAVRDIAASARQLDSGFSTRRAREELNTLHSAVGRVRNELRTLFSITGLGAFVGAGGVVAGLYAANRALMQFSETGLKLHYTARELNVTTDMLGKYTDALSVLGQSHEEAASGIQSALRALNELYVKGTSSNIFRELARGRDQSGRALAAELMDVLEKGGGRPEEAFKVLLERMEKMGPQAQASISRMFGLGTVGAGEMLNFLSRLHTRLRPNVDQLREFRLANINLDISLDNISTRLSMALTPAFAGLAKAIDDYLASPAGQKFLDEAGKWLEGMGKWISSEEFAEKLHNTVEGLKEGFAAANNVVQSMGLTWPKVLGILIAIPFAAWLLRIAAALVVVARFTPLIRVLTPLAAVLALLSLGSIEFQDKRTAEEKRKQGPVPTNWNDLILQTIKDLFSGNVDILPGDKSKPWWQRLLGPGASQQKEKDDVTDQFKKLTQQLDRYLKFYGGTEGGAAAGAGSGSGAGAPPSTGTGPGQGLPTTTPSTGPGNDGSPPATQWPAPGSPTMVPPGTQSYRGDRIIGPITSPGFRAAPIQPGFGRGGTGQPYETPQTQDGAQTPADGGGGDGSSSHWRNYLAGLSYLETSYSNPSSGRGGNIGFFQQNANDAERARRAGLPDPRYGNYTQQESANAAYIKRFHPEAAAAIERGDYDEAHRLLKGHWVSLPGGSQSQAAARYRMYRQILQGGGRRPPGEQRAPRSKGAGEVGAGAGGGAAVMRGLVSEDDSTAREKINRAIVYDTTQDVVSGKASVDINVGGDDKQASKRSLFRSSPNSTLAADGACGWRPQQL